MSGTKVEFSAWLADRVDLLPVERNPRGGRTSSWKISIGLSLERVVIHYHESSFAGIWERIMHEE